MPSTNDVSDLTIKLAWLVEVRNDWEHHITAIINRPALLGNIGKYIAAHIFDIRLEDSVLHKNSDGVFANGTLAGHTVNIRWYPQQEYTLDLAPGHPDFYLVMAGPRTPKQPANHCRPWLIETVYLFDSVWLITELWTTHLETTVRVPQLLWDEAELYPNPRNPHFTISEAQLHQLWWFAALSGKISGSH